ncbi:MAG TPA: hypothetical protein VGY98_07775, partial [Verrucomicrobiae bacterium]|nr:hypothetical protein [Verrucomicrobiae bacterium]
MRVLSVFLILGFSDSLKAAVMVTNVNSLAESTVQAAINSAVPGEVVQLPAGTATWTSVLLITNNISLVGAGSAKTIIIDEIPSSSFNDLIEWETVSNYTECELSGFQFQDGTSQGIHHPDYKPEVQFNGFCPVCRVTGCLFENLSDVGVCFFDGTYGCIDHCLFPTTNFANQVLCYNGALGGFSAADGENEYGDISYATPVTYGTTNWWIYIEDCGFSYNGPNYWSAVNDARAGTRVVFRYNSVTNMIFQFHGTETSGRIRGGRACEIYDNFFINNAVGYTNQGNPLGFRSGTGVIYSNIFVGWSTIIGLSQFRATQALVPYGGANGLDPWDSNGGLMATGKFTGPSGQQWLTDSSANWAIGQWVGGWPGSGNTNWSFELIDVTQGGTNYHESQNLVNFSIIESNGVHDIYYPPNHLGGIITWNNGDTYAIYKCYGQLDQPGRGLSDLIGDNAPSSGQPYDTVTGATNWPNQAIEPWYQWNNTNNWASAGFAPNIGYFPWGYFYPTIMAGRDYFDYTVKPGYTP